MRIPRSTIQCMTPQRAIPESTTGQRPRQAVRTNPQYDKAPDQRKPPGAGTVWGVVQDLPDLRLTTGASRILDLSKPTTEGKNQCVGLPLIWRAYFEFGSQKGCLAGTNSTGTLLTNVFSQRVHSSMPACSLGMWPMTIRAVSRAFCCSRILKSRC